MVCWMCAGLSFWGAVGAIGILAVVEAMGAVRRVRRGSGQPRTQIGQPVG